MSTIPGAPHYRLIDLGVLPEHEASNTQNQQLLKQQAINFDQVWPGQNPWGIEGAILFNHWAGPDCQWYLRLNNGEIQAIRVLRHLTAKPRY